MRTLAAHGVDALVRKSRCRRPRVWLPVLKKGLGPAATFWIYAAICAAGFVLILLRLPETKGKTLEEIENRLVGQKNP